MPCGARGAGHTPVPTAVLQARSGVHGSLLLDAVLVSDATAARTCGLRQSRGLPDAP